MALWIIGGLALGFVLWRGWGKPVLTRGSWRLGAGLLAVGCLVAAMLLGIRGQWPLSLPLLGAGAVLLYGARSERGPYRRRVEPPGPALSLEEARALLGVSASATADEVRAAYTRLMRMAHPDKGGTVGLAAQLNAARDRLLKG